MRHLKAFHVFHVAAQSASFTQAADTLHITHGAVSKQIKTLETYLGVPLFIKQGRHVVLTQEGMELRAFTSQAFSSLEKGVEQLRTTRLPHLEVSCEPTLTMRWLMPRMNQFHQQTSGDVRLSTAGGPVNLGSQGYHLAIRRDDFELTQPYQKQTLLAEWVGPVMSPQYWQSVQTKQQAMTLLHSQPRPLAWQEWLEEQSCEFTDAAEQTFEHFYFCLQAAQDGLGAAIGSYPLVMDEIERGRLVAPFGFRLSGHDYVLLRQQRDETALERQFIEWLKQTMALSVPRDENV
ncbi:LysR family transcriptional regulator [Vibrio fluvialis]|nr:LysR family transcriptional regulator [Vibrio fluvialis]